MKQNKLALLNTVLLGVMIVLQVVTMICFIPKQEAAVSTGNNTSSGSTDSSQDVINVEVVKIDTPYATLQYPSKWLTYLKHKENKGENFYSMTFICHISGQDAELFTVHFGQAQKGELIGNVEKNGEKVPFTIEKVKIDEGKWSKGDYSTICAMQDDVDVLIKSVSLA